MKKKSLVLAMGLGVAAAASSVAQADALLFPYYESNGNVYTFLSLYTSVNSNLHYIWNYNTDAAKKECKHEDAWGRSTANDILQHEVQYANRGITGGFTNSKGQVDQSSPAYSYNSAAYGFIIVSNWSAMDDIAANALTESTIAGEIVVVDAASGYIASMQKGLNDPGQFQDEGDFSSIFTSHSAYDLTWYPKDAVTTTWYTLVTGTGMDNPNNWGGKGTLSNGFANVYDRDENPRSGNSPRVITCHDFFGRDGLMTPAQVMHSDNGGYMFAVWTNDPTTTATGILMVKEQLTNAFAGGTTGGTVLENAFPNLPY